MRINLTSVYVDNQRAALAFYVDVLGFTKQRDVPLGERLLAHRRLAGVTPRPGAAA